MLLVLDVWLGSLCCWRIRTFGCWRRQRRWNGWLVSAIFYLLKLEIKLWLFLQVLWGWSRCECRNAAWTSSGREWPSLSWYDDSCQQLMKFTQFESKPYNPRFVVNQTQSHASPEFNQVTINHSGHINWKMCHFITKFVYDFSLRGVLC